MLPPCRCLFNVTACKIVIRIQIGKYFRRCGSDSSRNKNIISRSTEIKFRVSSGVNLSFFHKAWALARKSTLQCCPRGLPIAESITFTLLIRKRERLWRGKHLPASSGESGYRLIKIININSKMLEAKVAGAGGHSCSGPCISKSSMPGPWGMTSMRMA